jgi:hypothetical protein
VSRIAVAAAIYLGFLARAATFQAPLFDFHSWRQADTATIARNFVRGRFDPLRPEIDARGSRTDGAVETGLELMAILAGLAGRLAGFSTHLGRLIAALSFPLAALLLVRFARDRYGEATAVATAWIYAFGLPLSLFMDRAFMNEPLLALLTIVSLRSAQTYLAGRRAGLATLLVASTALGLVKPPYLIVWFAIAGLFVEQRGWRRGLASWELGAALAVNLAAVALWFHHAHEIYLQNVLTFGVTNKMFIPATLMSPEYWRLIFSRLARDLFGPVVFAAVVYGTLRAVAGRRWAELGGLAGFAVHLIVVTEGNFNHNYYQLPVMPIAAVLAGAGIVQWTSRAAASRGWDDGRQLRVATGILALAMLATFVRSANFHSWYETDRARQRTCEDLRPGLRPDDLVAFVGDLSPDILFCLDRRGWLYAETTPVPELRQLLNDGVNVIVIPQRYRELEQIFADVPQRRLLDSPAFLAIRVRD